MALSNPFGGMPPFIAALHARLDHGETKHGDRALWQPWSWTVEQLGDECADVAVWAWVLYTRAGWYPNAAEVQPAIKRWVRSSYALTRACVLLVEQLSSSYISSTFTKAHVSEYLADRRWLSDALTSEDRSEPRRAIPTRKIREAYAARCVARSLAGAQLHGDMSFDHDGTWLIRELADDLCGLTGWLHVLRAQLGLKGELGAHIRACQTLYDQLPAIRLLVAQGENTTPSGTTMTVPPPDAVGRWIEDVLTDVHLTVVAQSATTEVAS